LRFGQFWFWKVVSVSFGKVRGWFCRFSKSAHLFSAKVLVSWVCKIILASLALSIFGQSQVFQNCRSDSFIVLFGEVRFYRKCFDWLSLLVIWRFGGCRACRDTSSVFSHCQKLSCV
jgi:hypothetical protein